MTRGGSRNLVGRKGFQQGARGRAGKEERLQLGHQKWQFSPSDKRRKGSGAGETSRQRYGDREEEERGLCRFLLCPGIMTGGWNPIDSERQIEGLFLTSQTGG